MDAALLILSAMIARPAKEPPAKATIRIERPARASKDLWEREPTMHSDPHRRELRKIDDEGRIIVIRTIEFE